MKFHEVSLSMGEINEVLNLLNQRIRFLDSLPDGSVYNPQKLAWLKSLRAKFIEVATKAIQSA